MDQNETSPADGGILVVVTGSRQTNGTSVEQVRPIIYQKKVLVDSILLTSEADFTLKNLSSETGAISHFVSGNSATNTLYNALSDSVRSRIDDVRELPVTVGVF